jgi:spermidine/putrescine transport system substrate-binding protein
LNSRTAWLVTALVGLLVGVYVLKERLTPGKTLHVYSWSSYFPEEELLAFGKANGLTVEVSYFASNEELFAKMVAGASGYDVILPSDYMVTRMARRGMLQPLDKAQLPNISHLDPATTNPPYDPGLQYSIPYTLGNTGIVINTDKVKIPAEGVSWSMLLDSPDPRRTCLLDDMREVFAAALMWKGRDPSERDHTKLTEAGKLLQKTKKDIALFSSEPAPLLIKGEVTIAHAFTNHAVQAATENPAFKFFFPKEGAITWTDNLAIPKGAANVKEAHAFLNFFLAPDNALAATRMNGLGTPNRTAFLRLTPEERENPVLYPSQREKARLHFLDDSLGETMQFLSRLWTEMKSI